MRNLKKLLAVVVAICVLATFTVPAFADTADTKTDAQLCTDLGVLKGAGSGVTDAYLATTPNRLQGAIMFLRLLGLEEDALAFTGTDNFADVPATYAADSKAILAYLKAHPELGFEGVGGGNFAPAELMTAKQYYKIVLVALGFTYGTDFTWDNVLSFASAHGLSKLIDSASFTVNDLAIATIEGLKATVKDGSGTLVAKLAAADEDFAAKAIAAGLYTAPVVTPKVESVTADNLKEIVVTFNTALDKDSAEKADNYKLNDEALPSTTNAEGEDVDSSVALNADGKSVTITLAVAIPAVDNQTDHDLTVSGVKSAAGVEIEETTITFEPDDSKTPVAQSIKLVGPHTFEIAFSEPIAVEGTVSVEDDEYGVGEITVNGTRTATVQLSDSSLDEGKYKVVVKGFKDYADLKSLSKTFTLTYAKDTTAPTAKVVEATQKKVVIEFNKPVYAGDPDENQPLSAEYFYHSLSANIPDDGNIGIDSNKKFTLKWSDDKALPEGKVKVVVKASYDDKTVTDGWGNELENNLVFSVDITADNTKPEVTKIVVDSENTLKIYFSEDVDGDQAADPGNYVLKDKDGKDVDFDMDPYNDKDYYATLVTTENMDGTYTLKISGIEDKALDANKMLAVTKTVTVKDSTCKNLTNGAIKVATKLGTGTDPLKGQIIYVYYPEAMTTSGTYSILDKEKYQITSAADGITKDLKDGDKITTFEDNGKIKITIKDGNDYFGDGKDLDVTDITADPLFNTLTIIGKFADAAGNKHAPIKEIFDLKADVAPTISDIKTIDEKTLEITFNGKIKPVSKEGFKIAKNGGAIGDAHIPSSIKSQKLNDDGNTVVTVVLQNSEKIEAYQTGKMDFNVWIIASKLKSITDAPVLAAGPIAANKDGFAPKLIAKTTTVDPIAQVGSVIEIRFTEALKLADAGAFYNDLVITKGGDTLKAGIDFTTRLKSGNPSVIEVLLTASHGEKITVKSIATPKYIVDVAGNEAKAFTELARITWE